MPVSNWGALAKMKLLRAIHDAIALDQGVSRPGPKMNRVLSDAAGRAVNASERAVAHGPASRVTGVEAAGVALHIARLHALSALGAQLQSGASQPPIVD